MQTILYSVAEGVATITLNRPERLNAISAAVKAEVREALDRAEADEAVGAIVLTGAGRAFSAGMDLKDDAAAGVEGEAWRAVLADDMAFVLRFWESPKPTVAAVHGYCMAAAVELATACDVTIAEENTVFGKPELQFGSVVTTMLMPHLVGPKVAKELILAAEDRIDAARALAIRLINRVAPDGQALAEATALARRMARIDPDAVRLTKRAINRSVEAATLTDALAENLDLAVEIEATETPSRREFKQRVRRDGLQAALTWRTGRMS